jgi:two-component system CheB/CheR fusion protein
MPGRRSRPVEAQRAATAGGGGDRPSGDRPSGDRLSGGRPSGDRLSVVGIGASAGGLEAVKRLLAAMPADTGVAFILVQHLDPRHPSLLVELLAPVAPMPVVEAADGAALAPDHLYVIPSGAWLSVSAGALRLSPPPARSGARLPFDFLLRSLAAAYGPSAGCVVLSGAGADGGAGLLAIQAAGGFALAQDPAEAGAAEMPRNAARVGAAVRTLPAAEIPAALLAHRAGRAPAAAAPKPPAGVDAALREVVELLRARGHDFTGYKPGTLRRRVERRMALLAIRTDEAGLGMGRYLELLRTDAAELALLAKDLLINVTGFFRDASVFELLGGSVIPDMVRSHPPDRPLRLWVVGCSTGEETYSLAMLLIEQIAADGRPLKLQIFASDIDADAVAAAREGAYPAEIEAAVSAERLARFFSREEAGWRVLPELRSAVVFAVQDVLADPPFSRLDMVSCRNLLIYLRPEAQARLIALFGFALRDGGVLLLGGAESAGDEARFEPISKTQRIWRRTASDRSAEPQRRGPARQLAPSRPAEGAQGGGARPPSRQAALAELGRRLVLDRHAPASVLIGADNETLFSLGPVDRYLRMAPGHATHDLLAMARPGLRAKLRAAIAAARRTRETAVERVQTAEGALDVEASPVPEGGPDVLLVCFSPARVPAPAPAPEGSPAGPDRALERELAVARAELQDALRDLERSGEEQKAAQEEALSIDEEHQSTNEELLTSKEELQSLNEELTALNSQLQETLERQRTTADDLQNVLYSTNVATLFLDLELRIRFYTPAVTSLFAVLPGDVGRPLADLSALTPDAALAADARAVLATREPVERETEGADGVWFRRRILPYRAHGGRVEGVVITFTDVTQRKRAARALEDAKQQAEEANAAKSRFLAAASHDLRQPLQTLALLQGLLARSVGDGRARGLVARLDETLAAMGAMLDTLLDINEIEAGAIRAQPTAFAIDPMLDRLRGEFAYHAQAKGLSLRVMPCRLQVRSDPRLLEQMVRNLLSNALKYTSQGRVLVGCRRRGDALSFEVWDTGIGIAEAETGRIFEEYRQIGNDARERSRGLGLGLSIVRRLAELLGHGVSVRSRPGAGSVFSVLVPLAEAASPGPPPPAPAAAPAAAGGGAILVVEDDPDLRAALEQSLREDGRDVRSAADGPSAMRLLAGFAPDLLVLDFNLPNGPNGIELAGAIREAMGRAANGRAASATLAPVIVLTGDTSSETADKVAASGFVQLNKPVRHADLSRVVDAVLAAPPPPAVAADGTGGAGGTDVPAAPARAPCAAVSVVDDDPGVRLALVSILEAGGRTAVGYADGEAFLRAYQPGPGACLLVDAWLPGMSGIELIERLRAAGDQAPAIVITGRSDVPMAVRAMKAGASDFIEKPVREAELLASVARALEQSRDEAARGAWRADAARHVASLTPRQREIMARVLEGQPSKNIAADLGISRRTVESHRASIMTKTGAASLPALARLALAATPEDPAPLEPTA